jgi:hypothetical protein
MRAFCRRKEDGACPLWKKIAIHQILNSQESATGYV